MSISKGIGDIQEEVVIEWKLKDFLKSLKKDDLVYESCPFSFAGHFWYIEMYPNGRECNESTGYIGLYLTRMSSGTAIKIRYSLSFKTLDGRKDSKTDCTCIFKEVDDGYGCSKFLKMSELLKRKNDLLPSDVLTVICSLESRKPTDVETNQKLFNDLKELMLSGQHSDTTIKVKDKELRLHRSILESRNPFFRAMFNCEMKEKATGIVSIEDCDPDIFRSFIHFLYTGKVDKLSSSKVCELYYVADKYQEDQLKNECVQFMMNAVSVDNIADFITFAVKNDEKELFESISKYFCQKAKAIYQSVKWQNFMKEYPTEANELLIKTLDQYVTNDHGDTDNENYDNSDDSEDSD